MPQLELYRALRKIQKLTSMGPREIAHRLREKGYAELERFGLTAEEAEVQPAQDFKRWLAEAAASRFYPGVREAHRAFVGKHFPHWIDRAVEEADRLCRHQFFLLGLGEIKLEGPVDWHKDPWSGNVWEARFHNQYNLEHDQERDAKIIHELNRHQHLPRLAKAYMWTVDERYAAEAVAQMENWIEQNPAGYGINWHSSLEIAIRAVSWIWTILLLRESRAFDETTAQRIGRSLFAQLQHVERHLSRYSSPNTHLLGESVALYIAGTVFPEHPNAATWCEAGAAVLIEEAHKQILDDAVYGELSSWYHCYALDFYLQAIVLGRLNGRPFPTEVERTVQRMADFLMHLTRPDGSIPLLGDDDGGRSLALERRDYRSFKDALAVGAVLFDRQDFKCQSGGFSEEALWLLGPGGWEAYKRIEERLPETTSVFYPAAGYAIERSGWGPQASHLLFDCGGLGILTGGHAHADALSLTLFGGGRELLVDPATYVYNCQPQWRTYFRSTQAHNTVSADGASQSEMAGTFAWKKKLSSRGSVTTLRPQNGSDGCELGLFEGEHDGYSSLGLTHRRSLLRIPGDYWIVVDRFTGRSEHVLDFHYHFGPETQSLTSIPSDAGIEVWSENAGFMLGIYGSEPLRATLHRGEMNPIAGWASSGYGEKHPLPTLRAAMPTPDLRQRSVGALTFLATGAVRPVIKRLAMEAGHGVACTFERNGVRDVVIFTPDENEAQVSGLRTKGEFFWMRTRDDEVSAAAIRATNFEYRQINLLEDTSCAQFAAS